MKCTHSAFDPETDVADPVCENEATHDRNCSTGSAPVCASHTCRCSVTLEEAERRKAAKVAASEKADAVSKALVRVLEAARGVIVCTPTTVPLMDAIDEYDRLIGRKR